MIKYATDVQHWGKKSWREGLLRLCKTYTQRRSRVQLTSCPQLANTNRAGILKTTNCQFLSPSNYFPASQLYSVPSSSNYPNFEEIDVKLTTSGGWIPLPCAAVGPAVSGSSWQGRVSWVFRKHQLHSQETLVDATSQPSADHQLSQVSHLPSFKTFLNDPPSIYPCNLKLVGTIAGTEPAPTYERRIGAKICHLSSIIESATYKLWFTVLTTEMMISHGDTVGLEGELLMDGLCSFFIVCWSNFWASVHQNIVDHSAFLTLKLLHVVPAMGWSVGMAFMLWLLLAPQETPHGSSAGAKD